MRRYDDALRHYETAIAMNARIGAHGWLAHSQHEYAAMLFERGKDEDQTTRRPRSTIRRSRPLICSD